MEICLHNLWNEYELIDCGNGRKLERFGEITLIRPEITATGKPHLSDAQWKEMANAEFVETSKNSGQWDIFKQIPDTWTMSYHSPSGIQLTAELSLTTSKHIGIFPEQVINWQFIERESVSYGHECFLNLFGYTGLSTVFASNFFDKATHIDSIRKVVEWTRRNAENSGRNNIRLITEDAQKFVEREIKRGNKYDGIILDQQIKTIQEELGGSPYEKEIDELREKGKKKKWSKEIAEVYEAEIKKLEQLNPMSAEFSVQMNYMHVFVDLPWNEYTKDNFNLKHAQKVLDRDHFGLDEVKDRILEHLAVLKLKGDLKSPILCLYGPPGVGKTSLGKSIADALGRKYVRMSLGGLHDESEIRGHRRTYIGAMPGRILQNINKAKSSNPVFILDEIDKVGNDYRGDPSSALLEVLDPEQNTEFHDNFIDQEYDLSKVMFIATANNISTINPALRDRMEMIEISGYVTEEKLEIAKRHLIPKEFDNHGIKKYKIKVDDSAILKIIPLVASAYPLQ